MAETQNLTQNTLAASNVRHKEGNDLSRLLYFPLRSDKWEVRLLAIQPGAGEELQCSLEVFELYARDRPEYETISYCWGTSNHARDEVIVNGHRLDVPISAATVLRRIRLPDRPRIVWVDVISINQADEHERAEQVQIMGDIYSLGRDNLIYWCDDDPRIDEALGSVRLLLQEATDGGHLEVLYDESGWHRVKDSNSIKVTYNPSALAFLFSSQWLRRVWTFQEALVPKGNTCLCGTSTIGLLDILRVSAWLWCNNPSLDKQLFDALIEHRLLHRQLDSEYGIRGAISNVSPLVFTELIRARQCTRPVDKVYGILGMCQKTGSDLQIYPDYSKGLHEVYQEFAVEIIRISDDLSIFQHMWDAPNPEQRELQGLPSWIPDWNQPWNHDKHAPDLGPFFRAGSDKLSNASVRFEADNHAVLVAHGILLGTVSAVTGPMRDQIAVVQKEETITSAALRQSEIETDCEVSIAVTLCAGMDWQKQPATEDVMEDYRAWKNRISQNFEIPPLSEAGANIPDDVKMASQYQEAFNIGHHHRRMFAASNGVFGMGPELAEEGDIVVVVYGCRWPIMLRPRGSQYLFLGLCYVHGMMFGEVVQRHAETGEEDAVFEIR